MFEYIYIFVFMCLGVVFVLGAIIFGRILAPSKPNPVKESTYECGEKPIGSAWVMFNVRYYLVAMLFVIFDVEVMFLLPWAVAFKKLGLFAFIEMMVFLGILAIALIYAWRKDAIKWE